MSVNDETALEILQDPIRLRLHKFLINIAEEMVEDSVEVDWDNPIKSIDEWLEKLRVYRSQVEYVLNQQNSKRDGGLSTIKIGGEIQHLLSVRDNKIKRLNQKRIAVRGNLTTMGAVLDCDFTQMTHAQRNGVNILLKELVTKSLIESDSSEDYGF